VEADPRLLGSFDASSHSWKVAAGDYGVNVGASAIDTGLQGSAKLFAQTLKP
jgi:hypothetical protein